MERTKTGLRLLIPRKKVVGTLKYTYLELTFQNDEWRGHYCRRRKSGETYQHRENKIKAVLANEIGEQMMKFLYGDAWGTPKQVLPELRKGFWHGKQSEKKYTGTYLRSGD